LKDCKVKDRIIDEGYSIILATTRTYEAVLWTQDAHFRDIEGVQYIEKKP